MQTFTHAEQSQENTCVLACLKMVNEAFGVNADESEMLNELHSIFGQQCECTFCRGSSETIRPLNRDEITSLLNILLAKSSTPKFEFDWHEHRTWWLFDDRPVNYCGFVEVENLPALCICWLKSHVQQYDHTIAIHWDPKLSQWLVCDPGKDQPVTAKSVSEVNDLIRTSKGLEWTHTCVIRSLDAAES